MSKPRTHDQPQSEDRRTRRAIVIEDDKAIRSLAATVLLRRNFVVDQASNGHEALRLLFAHVNYDLIVLDLMMPEMSGLEVLEQLQSRDAQALARVLVMTAAVPLVQRGLPEGLCDVLIKPFDLTEFHDAVTKCLSGAPRKAT